MNYNYIYIHTKMVRGIAVSRWRRFIFDHNLLSHPPPPFFFSIGLTLLYYCSVRMMWCFRQKLVFVSFLSRFLSSVFYWILVRCIECCCVCHQGQIGKKADTCLNLYPCVIKYYLILSYLSLCEPCFYPRSVVKIETPRKTAAANLETLCQLVYLSLSIKLVIFLWSNTERSLQWNKSVFIVMRFKHIKG